MAREMEPAPRVLFCSLLTRLQVLPCFMCI